MYYIYIIECAGGALYTGITTDYERRFSEHLSGTRGAKFTRAHPPERIRALWSTSGGKSAALRLEYAIKKLRREQKLRLISDGGLFAVLLPGLDLTLYHRLETAG